MVHLNSGGPYLWERGTGISLFYWKKYLNPVMYTLQTSSPPPHTICFHSLLQPAVGARMRQAEIRLSVTRHYLGKGSPGRADSRQSGALQEDDQHSHREDQVRGHGGRHEPKARRRNRLAGDGEEGLLNRRHIVELAHLVVVGGRAERRQQALQRKGHGTARRQNLLHQEQVFELGRDAQVVNLLQRAVAKWRRTFGRPCHEG